MSCDPTDMLCTLFGFTHCFFSLSVYFTITPPPPYSSIPGFIPSLLISLHPSNPHLFLIGAVRQVRNTALCAIPKANEWRKEQEQTGWTYDSNLREAAAGRGIQDPPEHLVSSLRLVSGWSCVPFRRHWCFQVSVLWICCCVMLHGHQGVIQNWPEHIYGWYLLKMCPYFWHF